jgi:hypothetical protein
MAHGISAVGRDGQNHGRKFKGPNAANHISTVKSVPNAVTIGYNNPNRKARGIWAQRPSGKTILPARNYVGARIGALDTRS